MGFINKYPVEIKYGVHKHDNLFLQMLYFGINSDDVYKIVTPCENWKHRQAPPPPPLQKQNKPISSLSQKSRTRTQSGVTLPHSQHGCGHKVGVSNYEVYNSGNLPHIPQLTTSSHVHPFGIRNLKNRCFFNVILHFFYSVLRTTRRKCTSIIVSKVKFQNAYSIQHITYLVHKKWIH